MSFAEALNLARQHHADALQFVAQAVALPPDDPRVVEKLAVALKDAGRNAEAATLFGQLVPQDADSFFMQASYGQVLQALGRIDEAIERYRRALELRPDYADIWAVTGALLLLQKKNAEAEPALRRALALQPDAANVQANLGITLCGLGRYAEAEPLLRRALQNLPELAGTLLNPLGTALHGQRRYAEAEAVYRQNLQQRPDNADAWNNLGVSLNALGRRSEAESVFRRALELRPDFYAAHNNLGRALITLAKHAAAEQALRLAVERYPDSAALSGNLAIALLLQGKHVQAGETARHVLQTFPDSTDALSTMLYAMNCDASCTPAQYLAVARRYGEVVDAMARPFDSWRTALPGSTVEPLRIGLVSGDMRTHPVGFFLENLVRHSDPQRLQFVAYQTGGREDALTARLKSHLAGWTDISMLSDAEASRKIHDDGIHVLIDLAGHTTHNRLPLFAWKAAPLQVAWLGYFASTGIAAIDYVLVDEVSVTADEHTHFTERIWRLPETRLCFTPPANDEAGEVAVLPALNRGHVTFGSFQNMIKLDDPVLALWAHVLAAVPQSRLRVQNAEMTSDKARESLLKRLAGHEISAARVELIGSMPRADYFAAHANIDIILDTFPYPGGTTTCEALWMGVPTLTLRGNTLLSRQGASLLGAAGLTDWIAHDEADYVARAVRHAGDLARLARLRAALREQIRTSPLCDGPRFARHFADAIHGMWRSTTISP